MTAALAAALSLFAAPAFAQDINPDILYRISSPSGLAVSNHESPANSANLFLEKSGSGEGQPWKVVKLENGY